MTGRREDTVDAGRLGGVARRSHVQWGNLRDAVEDLVSQELSVSTGHVTALVSGCLFAPSLLSFWFVNGVMDFSTALALGSVGSAAGLQIRVLAYVLVVPTFLLLRVGVHLLHPAHRKQVLSGTCPRTDVLSLDWFSVGILATGLPLSLKALGPWVSMNAVFLLGLFVTPRVASSRVATASKLVAIVLGPVLFLYAKYGGAVPAVPEPAAVLGPVATLTLSEATTAGLMEVTNSLVVGPVVVGAFAVVMNHLLTHPEVRSIPYLRYALPDRDPDGIVLTSASIGTIFYLLVVGATTGAFTVFP